MRGCGFEIKKRNAEESSTFQNKYLLIINPSFPAICIPMAWQMSLAADVAVTLAKAPSRYSHFAFFCGFLNPKRPFLLQNPEDAIRKIFRMGAIFLSFKP